MDRNYFKLNRIPFAVKLYVGFALFVFLLMGLIQLHSYIKCKCQYKNVQF